MVSSLMTNDGSRWDGDILNHIFSARDRDLIMKIPLSLREEDDSWSWHLERKGDFSVKSSYRYLQTSINIVGREVSAGWRLMEIICTSKN